MYGLYMEAIRRTVNGIEDGYKLKVTKVKMLRNIERATVELKKLLEIIDCLDKILCEKLRCKKIESTPQQ